MTDVPWKSGDEAVLGEFLRLSEEGGDAQYCDVRDRIVRTEYESGNEGGNLLRQGSFRFYLTEQYID